MIGRTFKRVSYFIAAGAVCFLLTLWGFHSEAANLNITSAKITFGPTGHSFQIKGTLDSSPVDFVLTPVTIGFGVYSETIPAGTFTNKKGKYSFTKPASTPGIYNAKIDSVKKTFQIKAKNILMTGTTNPTRFSIDMGSESACVNLVMVSNKKGNIWSFKPGGTQSPCDASQPPAVFINSPTSYSGYATTQGTIVLGGAASDDVAVTRVDWTNDRGGSGTATGTSEWSIASINLQPGDNVITVTAYDTGLNSATDQVTITYSNNGVLFLGIPTSNPDGFFVNEPTDLITRVQIAPNPDIDTSSVKLLRILEDQTVVEVGSMLDNGQLFNGDEIQGDGIYSAINTFTIPATGTLRFRVSAKSVSDPAKTANSPVFTVAVEEHLTNEQLQTAVSIALNAEDQFNQFIQSNDLTTSLSMTVEWLNQQGILDAGVSETGEGVWWLNSSGILGGLVLYEEGFRGGERGSAKAVPNVTLKKGIEGLHKAHAPRVLPAAEDVEYIGSKKAKVMAAFHTQFEGWGGDETDEIYGWLVGSVCPKFEVAPHLKDGAVTVEEFKNLHEYGIVVITSHGDTWYKGLLSLWQEKWGWNSWGGQVVILANQTASEANKALYELDLKQGRLAITNSGRYAILPSFITYYNGAFPRSIIYSGSCRSRYNTSMSNAFLSLGAKTYLGYTEYVSSVFAYNTGMAIFNKMINQGLKTGEAFVAGLNDGKAYFVMDGSNKLSLQVTDLINGGFEEGNLNGWSRAGDGRVITQLGLTPPTEGGYMGIISTGLGFTTDSGSIWQPFCIPALPEGKTAIKLLYDWNYYSEEFLEYCESIYQDYFSVGMNATNLQYNNVDSLCGSVYAADVSFDIGDVYTTGWLSAEKDVTAFAGQGVTLTFAAGDVGDSIYDTAILIDNVRVVIE